MYEAVRVAAEGRTTPARFGATVADAGFDGVVLAADASSPVDVDPEPIADEYGIDVVAGIEVTAREKGQVASAVSDRRDETAALLVRGGVPEINRYAVETPTVDVLRDPMAGEGDVNHVLVKAAVENDVRIEVSLGRVLRASGGPRVQALRDLRKLVDLLEHFEAPFAVSADPRVHLDVRGPRALLALGDRIGLDAQMVREGLEEWETIVAENRERLSPEAIAAGIRRGRYDG
ncbi:MAG: RNase P subunit p30 family protein [Halanaeroarchaeum sp.]